MSSDSDVSSSSSSSEEEEEEDEELELRALQKFAGVKPAASAVPAASSKNKKDHHLVRMQHEQKATQRKEDKIKATKASERMLDFSNKALLAADSRAPQNLVQPPPQPPVQEEDEWVLYNQAAQDLAKLSDDGVRAGAVSTLERLAASASASSNASLAVSCRLALARYLASRFLLRDAIAYYHEILSLGGSSLDDAALARAVASELHAAYQSLGIAPQMAGPAAAEEDVAKEVDAELEAALLHNDVSLLEARCFAAPPHYLAQHRHAKSGATALHIACGKQLAHVAFHLLAHGADWRVKDARGMNSLAWALRFMPDKEDGGDGGLARQLMEAHGAVVDADLYALIQTWPAPTRARVDRLMQSVLLQQQ